MVLKFVLVGLISRGRNFESRWEKTNYDNYAVKHHQKYKTNNNCFESKQHNKTLHQAKTGQHEKRKTAAMLEYNATHVKPILIRVSSNSPGALVLTITLVKGCFQELLKEKYILFWIW